MTIEEMIRISSAQTTTGGIFQKKLTLVGAQNSNAIMLPEKEVYAIGVQSPGDAVIFATCSSKQDIINDIAIWEEWDGSSQFNNAITAIKAENTTGTSTIIINTRTAEAESN